MKLTEVPKIIDPASSKMIQNWRESGVDVFSEKCVFTMMINLTKQDVEKALKVDIIQFDGLFFETPVHQLKQLLLNEHLLPGKFSIDLTRTKDVRQE